MKRTTEREFQDWLGDLTDRDQRDLVAERLWAAERRADSGVPDPGVDVEPEVSVDWTMLERMVGKETWFEIAVRRLRSTPPRLVGLLIGLCPALLGIAIALLVRHAGRFDDSMIFALTVTVLACSVLVTLAVWAGMLQSRRPFAIAFTAAVSFLSAMWAAVSLMAMPPLGGLIGVLVAAAATMAAAQVTKVTIEPQVDSWTVVEGPWVRRTRWLVPAVAAAAIALIAIPDRSREVAVVPNITIAPAPSVDGVETGLTSLDVPVHVRASTDVWAADWTKSVNVFVEEGDFSTVALEYSNQHYSRILAQNVGSGDDVRNIIMQLRLDQLTREQLETLKTAVTVELQEAEGQPLEMAAAPAEPTRVQ